MQAGLTTFSTFGYETIALARDGDQLRALGNVMLHVVLELSGVWLGVSLSRAWRGDHDSAERRVHTAYLHRRGRSA